MDIRCHKNEVCLIKLIIYNAVRSIASVKDIAA